jgi:hypothetical protein
MQYHGDADQTTITARNTPSANQGTHTPTAAARADDSRHGHHRRPQPCAQPPVTSATVSTPIASVEGDNATLLWQASSGRRARSRGVGRGRGGRHSSTTIGKSLSSRRIHRPLPTMDGGMGPAQSPYWNGRSAHPPPSLHAPPGQVAGMPFSRAGTSGTRVEEPCNPVNVQPPMRTPSADISGCLGTASERHATL